MRTIIVFDAPVDLVEALDDVLAGLLLVVGGDGILDIQKDDVRGGLRGLLEQGRVGTRHREFGAMQARRGGLDGGETHDLVRITSGPVAWIVIARLSGGPESRRRCS